MMVGVKREPTRAVGNQDDEGGKHFSLLQQQEEISVRDNGSKQIVFV